ncbi:MAG: Holliday junction resolvase RuvX [Cyclobacteriaceae bacterium]|nr:Holliday junction resolvase RuvX [Cyclobacteriaceae bacterium]
MGRILGIDYGIKRVGIAVTDPLKIISTPLDTIDTPQIFNFLEKYLASENVEKIIVGLPVNLDQSDTEGSQPAREFIEKLSLRIKTKYPEVQIIPIDERFTSKLAFQAMIDGGLKKKQRRDKKLIDKVSASLILQTYLGS